MKTDHFAEFRRLQTEITGNEGHRVRTPEKSKETRSFSSGASVTQIREPRVPRVTGHGLDSDVTHVTQAVRARVTGRERQKSEQNHGNPESVTRVTHVAQKNNGDGRATAAECRATWTRSLTPDSRHPLIPPEVRAKIESIEAEARAKGWPAELLWNGGFWDSPRGLAAVLDREDEIAEVTADCIAILRTKRDVLRFRRHAA
jgi:hypothetical protein